VHVQEEIEQMTDLKHVPIMKRGLERLCLLDEKWWSGLDSR
jgi:hypothetical protein